MTGSVRAARVALADALSATGTATGAEARSLLAQALADPGDDPPGWAIHDRLATLAARAGDDLEQFEALFVVARDAPPDVADQAAATLSALLRDDGSGRLAQAVSADEVNDLVARASGADGTPELLRSAAQLAFARGDTGQARTLASRSGDPSLIQDPALAAAWVIDEAYRRIDAGADHAALALLAEHMPPDDDPRILTVRALASYGLRDFAEALALLERAPSTYRGAVVRVLSALALAENADPDESAQRYDLADECAAEAARLETTDGETREALLLRAQVALERGTDLAEAAHLLDRALRRAPDLDTLWWWRVQRRVRELDDRFSFVRFQVAASREDDGLVIGLWELLNQQLILGTTTRLQDAALATVVGAALERVGRHGEAAGAYRSAAASLEWDGTVSQRLAASTAAYRLGGLPDDALKAAELHWQQSFGTDPAERDAEVAVGLQLLDEAHRGAGADHDYSAYLRGLLLARRAAGADSPQPRRWEPLPWLLTAALTAPTDSYRSAHLAWALDTALLRYPALHFGNRAVEAGGTDDQWLRETAIVVRFNWYGFVDDETRSLFTGLDDRWRDAVLAFSALLADDPAMADYLSATPHDDTWVRYLRGVITARCRDLADARDLFEQVLEEGSDVPITATQASLYLGDLAGARRQLADWQRSGLWEPSEAREFSALCDLIDSDGRRGYDQMTAEHRQLARPYRLREFARADVPVLLRAYPDRRGLVVALEELKRRAEQRIAHLDTHPPLLAASAEAGPTVADDAAAVRDLLHVEDALAEHVRGRDPVGPLSGLIGRTPEGPFASALNALLGRLRE